MTNGEYERIGPQGRQRVLDKFYLDVQFLASEGMSYANLTSSAEEMMRDSELGLNEVEIETRVRKAFDGYHVDMPTELLSDRMMVLPLEILSDHIDTQLSIDEAMKWYEKLLNRAKINMRSEHSSSCLEFEPIVGNEACAHSPYCPQRRIGQHLEHMALYAYKSVYEEEVGPVYDDYALARKKVILGVKKGYITHEHSHHLLDRHTKRYLEYTQKIGRRAIEAPKAEVVHPPEDFYPGN